MPFAFSETERLAACCPALSDSIHRRICHEVQLFRCLSCGSAARVRPARDACLCRGQAHHADVYRRIHGQACGHRRRHETLRTNGRVVIEYYNPNTICAEADIYDSVRSGVVDMGVANVSRKKGKLPLLEILDLPFLFTSAESGSVAAWRLWNEFPAMQKETDDVHVISLHVGAPSQIQTTGAPAMSDADMAKLKIAAYAASYADVAKALGASPVTVGPTDIYLSMQRGQTDAAFAPYAYMRTTKIYETARHTYEANINCGGMYVTMNREVWASLPDDVKQIINELSGENYARMVGRAIDQSCRDDLEFMKTKGQKVSVVPAEVVEGWKKRCEGIVQEWIDAVARRGHQNGAEMVARARALDREAML